MDATYGMSANLLNCGQSNMELNMNSLHGILMSHDHPHARYLLFTADTATNVLANGLMESV